MTTVLQHDTPLTPLMGGVIGNDQTEIRKVQASKTGLFVTIPLEYSEECHITKGSFVKLTKQKDSSVIIMERLNL